MKSRTTAAIRSKRRFWAALLGGLGLAGLWLARPRAWSSPQTASSAASGGSSFRVLFGLKDRTGQSWDGAVEAPGGRVIRLEPWHFGEQDRVVSATEWRASTRPRAFNRVLPESPDPTPMPVGLLLTVAGSRVEVQTREKGKFAFFSAEVPPAGALVFLDGQVAVEQVPEVTVHATAEAEEDYPELASGPDGTLWMSWQSYRNESDSVWGRRFDGKSWGPPSALLEKGDVYRTAVAIAGAGSAAETWVVWSQQLDGNWDLYGRRYRGGRWFPAVRLTEAPEPDVLHRLARDAAGNLWLVWQGSRGQQFDILARHYDGRAWGPEQNISRTPENDWEPAVAADAKGNVWVAWDGYENGNYDVFSSRFDGKTWSKAAPIAASANFEARVTLSVDGAGLLWAAWEEGGRNWGKDTGFTIRGGGEPGTGLYAERRVRMACQTGDRWMQPRSMPQYPAPHPAFDFRDRPQLEADETGRLWLAWRGRYRLRFGQGMGGAAGAGAWETFLASFDEGGRWAPARFVPNSAGRGDSRVALAAARGGGVWLAQATDNRRFYDNRPGNYDLITTRLTATGRMRPWDLAPLQIDATEAPLSHAGERADIAAIRAYRTAGKQRIVRGDMHRHTDISFGDGLGDGSLLDAYRYALDAAGFDYLAVTDHNYGDNEYSWWRTQKSADLFRLGEKFIPLYAYERSLPYPNGHRNVVHARRGVRWLPIPEEERKGAAGAARLYEYLKKTAGIAMSHTSATNMGTDWRDNDPEVEPLVEIYQGDRTNYEYEGAPRSASAARPEFQPGGYRPAGFVRNAWARGYKLGTQASSDHLSTHISYAMLLVDNFSREGMIEAIRRRHAYAATDNIILDVSMETPSGERHIQGDISLSDPRPRLKAHIRGTAMIDRVEVIKNNNIVYSTSPGCQTCDVEYTDYDPDSAMSAVASESFYYVRVRQFDGQLAWSSPIWTRRK